MQCNIVALDSCHNEGQYPYKLHILCLAKCSHSILCGTTWSLCEILTEYYAFVYINYRLNMYVVINTLSIYECDFMKAPKCIEKSLDFVQTKKKYVLSPTRTVN